MTTLRTAAQQALEALESGVSLKLGWMPDCEDAITALKAALAEPVQEPVAWQWLDTAHFRKKIPVSATPAHWRPLFTSPPQRKPPIADEALWEMWVDSPSDVLAFARRIEMWHGITGGSDE